MNVTTASGYKMADQQIDSEQQTELVESIYFRNHGIWFA